MSAKLELVWTEDNRSIGILEESDDDTSYKPLIMLNFKFHGYISGESNPYRGYQVLIQTARGSDFMITITERELQSFPLFVSAVKSKTHGEVIQHASFDNSLWTDMVPKLLLEYPDMARMRPALNWGIQYKTLVVKAPGDKSKLMREHLEIVYPGGIYDGWGVRTQTPVHVVVPELMGNIGCRILASEDSGLIGLLQRFLPPFTSRDPECRDQQVFGLCAFIGITHYRFIVDYLGGCPGLTFISTDPGTLKTDTSRQGTLLAGDTGYILTSTSSDPAIEAAQCQASWVTVHDDAESTRGTHRTLVGGYNGGTKGLVSKAVNNEKIGGVCKTENLTAKKVMEPKTVEGREVMVHMKKDLREASAGMSHSERYDARRDHLKALATMTLPRDYMASFTGAHFTHSSLEDKDVPFVTAHKSACDLLSEIRPNYGDRRLGSQAIPLTIFLLIERDVEEANDERTTALFVEAFGDRETFFNVCVKELEKAELIIDNLGTNKGKGDSDEEHDDFVGDQDIPESQEDKIKALLDLFKEKDLVTLTKYIKIFTQGKSQVLGIAHTKLNTDYDKAFKKLNIVPDDDKIKHVKSFTKLTGDEMSGKNSMIATVCKVFHLKKFSKTFREMVLNIFNMETIEDDEIEDDLENTHAASQDYPEHTQSRTSKTLRICNCCKYKTRDDCEFEEHMRLHSKCPQCGLFFSDNGALAIHHEAFHALITCNKCGKDILQVNLKKHLNSHEIQKGFKKVISKGKVKAKSSTNEETEPKVAKLTGYRLFLQTKRPEMRNQNPDATPQEMIKILNEAWNREKMSGNKESWDKKAKENEQPKENRSQPEENHAIRKCSICGLMIANLNAHMMINHSENQAPILVPSPAPLDDSSEVQEAANTSSDAQQEDTTTTHLETHPEPTTTITGSSDEEVSFQNDDSTNDPFNPGNLVMVLRKSLHWPAKVLSRNTNLVEVMIFDKARTTEVKQPKFLVPFVPDVAACEGRGAVWIKAWKEAKQEYDNKFASEM